ncbi:isoflavone reductase-like protein IRL [Cladorrhinum sp. PSN259]|nr:isoflavone reductase-like protein IRL [Cladorrhinum sp. PSN259]
MAIKTVAVIGASGSVGTPVVQSLLAAGFAVTAVTRANSSSTFPSAVKVQKADLNSLDSLTEAFKGQDAVVSTVAYAGTGNQNTFADAAIAAGVKRFIPAEFGTNTRPGKGTTGVFGAQLMAEKTKAVDYLIQEAAKHPEFSWTGIATGLFFDWGLDKTAFGVNFSKRETTLIDSGDEKVSVSNLGFVGDAVAAVLKHEEETKNKYLEVAEHTITRNQVLKIFEDVTGEKFAVKRITKEELDKIVEEKLSKQDRSAFFESLVVYCFADGADKAFKEEDLANGILGLKSGDLKENIRDYVKAKSA